MEGLVCLPARIAKKTSVLRYPPTCFISHSYKDADAGYVEQLLKHLPPSVIPLIFPPITVSPEQRVSDDLVRAVLSCGGLIYITSQNSSESVWVSFERDLAIRNRLSIFSFDPKTELISVDHGGPLPLNVFSSYAHADEDKVFKVTGFMSKERSLNFFEDIGKEDQFKIHIPIMECLKVGGYLIFFVSQAALNSKRVAWEIESATDNFSSQVLLAFLEPLDVSAISRISSLDNLHIYRADDPDQLDWNQIDDLIVRIYHMVHKNNRTSDAINRGRNVK